MVKNLGLAFSLVFASWNLSAGEYGDQHNRYVDCLEHTLPAGTVPSWLVILDTLVQECGYPVDDYARFITIYQHLGQTTLARLNRGGLTNVISPYSRMFNEKHRAFIGRIEAILTDSTDYIGAHARLARLFNEAIIIFCHNSYADIAVLAAVDIAASSALYWGEREEAFKGPSVLKAKWWQVALADVAGGIVGGVFGGGVGAVGLGSAASGYVASL